MDPSDVDQKLYDRLSDIITQNMEKKEGYRALVIVPNYDSQEYLYGILKKKLKDDYVIKFYPTPGGIPDSLFFSEEKAKKFTKNFIFISVDLTHRPIFLTELDIVYDSGEKDQIYETRTGMNRIKTVKINRQEMKVRMMSYAPEHYMIMFPKTSILSLEKYFTPDINDDLDVLSLINLGIFPEYIPDNLYNYGVLKHGEHGNPTITEKGVFCMNITIPIKHSSFLYDCFNTKSCVDKGQTAIALVSIFNNIDLYGISTSFKDIYLSISKSDPDPSCPGEIISSIKELSGALKLERKILDPIKEFNSILPEKGDRFVDHYLPLCEM